MKLDEFCATLEEKLSSASDDGALRLASLALQQAFKVEDDEVAFLKVDQDTESLYFIWPSNLGKAGRIPLNTRDSFAAETVRDSRPQLHNRFSTTYHASIFEQVKFGDPTAKKGKNTSPGPDRPKTIQKIMSAPLINDEQTIGAVQVCRKADDINNAGDDFEKAELEALTEIAKVIGKNI